MATTNKTRYAILGMLMLEPMSGYDIKKHIERNLSYFWNENYGHIYPILKRLEADGWVTKRSEAHGGKPTRYVYTITALGKEKLTGWLAAPVERVPIRDETMFKLFFGNMLPLEVNKRRIADELRQAAERKMLLDRLEEDIRAELKRHEDDVTLRNSLIFRFMTVRQSRYAVRSHMQWCKECLDILSGMENEEAENEGE